MVASQVETRVGPRRELAVAVYPDERKIWCSIAISFGAGTCWVCGVRDQGEVFFLGGFQEISALDQIRTVSPFLVMSVKISAYYEVIIETCRLADLTH